MNKKNMRKTILNILQPDDPECVDGKHCPEGVPAGLAPHAIDGPLHTGNLPHGDLSGVAFTQHHNHYARYFPNPLDMPIEAFQTPVAGRVYLTIIQILFTVTIDRIGFAIQAGTSAGNARVALYEDNGDTPFGGALIVESASIAVVDYKNELTVVDTQLTPQLVWGAVQVDDITNRIARCHHDSGALALGEVGIERMRFDNVGGYGAFPDPCAGDNEEGDGNVPWTFVRVKSVP